MRDEGLSVYAVTVLGASLSDILSEPEDGIWEAWLDAFQADDPILRDRGYGYALTETSSYPVYAVIAPDMTLMYIDTGYGSTTWDAIADTIRAHQEGP